MDSIQLHVEVARSRCYGVFHGFVQASKYPIVQSLSK